MKSIENAGDELQHYLRLRAAEDETKRRIPFGYPKSPEDPRILAPIMVGTRELLVDVLNLARFLRAEEEWQIKHLRTTLKELDL